MYQTILVCLDGSEYSIAGGEAALKLARYLGSKITALHVYAARLHDLRFRDMEPGLAEQYQEERKLENLRDTHTTLISEGLEALSRGYMDKFVDEARSGGIQVNEANTQGRNYVKILEEAEERGTDLIVLGAHGLGRLDDGILGSTASRVLRHAVCDVLIVRRPLSGGRVAVGVDGSDEARTAVRKAAVWTRLIQGSLELVAAYDPFFHNKVFKTMAGSLSPERREEVGLSEQEKLHKEIIDDGLGALYADFLKQADELASSLGLQAETRLLRGKVYRAFVDHLNENNCGLAVVGRYGHHRDNFSTIGSNAEAVVRYSSVNVLVTASEEDNAREHRPDIEWAPEALARLDRVPVFARSMARRSVEEHVIKTGGEQVTLEDFLEVAGRFGMNPGKGNDNV